MIHANCEPKVQLRCEVWSRASFLVFETSGLDWWKLFVYKEGASVSSILAKQTQQELQNMNGSSQFSKAKVQVPQHNHCSQSRSASASSGACERHDWCILHVPYKLLNKHSTAGDLGYCMFFSSSTTLRPSQYFCFGGCNSLTQGNNFTQIQQILSHVDRTPRLTANLGLSHQSKQEFPKLKGCKTDTELPFLLPDLQVTRAVLPSPGVLS